MSHADKVEAATVTASLGTKTKTTATSSATGDIAVVKERIRKIQDVGAEAEEVEENATAAVVSSATSSEVIAARTTATATIHNPDGVGEDGKSTTTNGRRHGQNNDKVRPKDDNILDLTAVDFAPSKKNGTTTTTTNTTTKTAGWQDEDNDNTDQQHRRLVAHGGTMSIANESPTMDDEQQQQQKQQQQQQQQAPIISEHSETCSNNIKPEKWGNGIQQKHPCRKLENASKPDDSDDEENTTLHALSTGKAPEKIRYPKRNRRTDATAAEDDNNNDNNNARNRADDCLDEDEVQFIFSTSPRTTTAAKGGKRNKNGGKNGNNNNARRGSTRSSTPASSSGTRSARRSKRKSAPLDRSFPLVSSTAGGSEEDGRSSEVEVVEVAMTMEGEPPSRARNVTTDVEIAKRKRRPARSSTSTMTSGTEEKIVKRTRRSKRMYAPLGRSCPLAVEEDDGEVEVESSSRARNHEAEEKIEKRKRAARSTTPMSGTRRSKRGSTPTERSFPLIISSSVAEDDDGTMMTTTTTTMTTTMTTTEGKSRSTVARETTEKKKAEGGTEKKRGAESPVVAPRSEKKKPVRSKYRECKFDGCTKWGQSKCDGYCRKCFKSVTSSSSSSSSAAAVSLVKTVALVETVENADRKIKECKFDGCTKWYQKNCNGYCKKCFKTITSASSSASAATAALALVETTGCNTKESAPAEKRKAQQRRTTAEPHEPRAEVSAIPSSSSAAAAGDVDGVEDDERVRRGRKPSETPAPERVEREATPAEREATQRHGDADASRDDPRRGAGTTRVRRPEVEITADGTPSEREEDDALLPAERNNAMRQPRADASRRDDSRKGCLPKKGFGKRRRSDVEGVCLPPPPDDDDDDREAPSADDDARGEIEADTSSDPAENAPAANAAQRHANAPQDDPRRGVVRVRKNGFGKRRRSKIGGFCLPIKSESDVGGGGGVRSPPPAAAGNGMSWSSPTPSTEVLCSSHFTPDQKAFRWGDFVMVERRGDRSGGVGRVTHVRYLPSDDGYDSATTYDVSYILGGEEKGVDGSRLSKSSPHSNGVAHAEPEKGSAEEGNTSECDVGRKGEGGERPRQRDLEDVKSKNEENANPDGGDDDGNDITMDTVDAIFPPRQASHAATTGRNRGGGRDRTRRRCRRCGDLNPSKSVRCGTCRFQRPTHGTAAVSPSERALLERTRRELLAGRDFWICTRCVVGVPSLTSPCGRCRRKIDFVPLDAGEFEEFVRKRRAANARTEAFRRHLAQAWRRREWQQKVKELQEEWSSSDEEEEEAMHSNHDISADTLRSSDLSLCQKPVEISGHKLGLTSSVTVGHYKNNGPHRKSFCKDDATRKPKYEVRREHSRIELDWKLVLPEDAGLISTSLHIAMEQMVPCSFDPSEHALVRRNGILSGHPGLCCKHCMGLQRVTDSKHAIGYWFPVSENTLYYRGRFTAGLENHVRNCMHCPPEVKEKMKTAVQAEPNKVFGRAEFVRRLWHRLNGPRDGASVGKEECLQGQRKKIVSEKKQKKRHDNHTVTDNKNVPTKKFSQPPKEARPGSDESENKNDTENHAHQPLKEASLGNNSKNESENGTKNLVCQPLKEACPGNGESEVKNGIKNLVCQPLEEAHSGNDGENGNKDGTECQVCQPLNEARPGGESEIKNGAKNQICLLLKGSHRVDDSKNENTNGTKNRVFQPSKKDCTGYDCKNEKKNGNQNNACQLL